MPIVLRIARRRTSWEGRDVQEILETEFRGKDGAFDLRPSVYVLESKEHSEVVQTHAEHAASFLQAPPKSAIDFDLDGLSDGPLVDDGQDGPAKFEHARRIHHELVFDGEDALRATVEALVSDTSGREYEVTRKDMLDYAIDRFDATDLEWRRALAEPPAIGWTKMLEKRRGQRASE